MKLANIILSVITLALSVHVFYVCRQFSEVVDSVPGPGIWPKALSICLFGVSLYLLVTTVIFSKKSVLNKTIETSEDNRQEEQNIFSATGTIRAYIMMGIALVYLVFMMLVGFKISTTLFIIFIMLFMGEKRIWLALVTGVGSSVGLYFLFYNIFRINLPVGMLFS